jgi:hypothetical protein
MPVPDGKVLVYVYRPDETAPTRKVQTFVNGERLGDIGARTYYVAVVDPGDVVVEFPSAAGAARVAMQARAGERYVVRQEIERLPIGLVTSETVRLAVVDVDHGTEDRDLVERELECCRLIRVAAVGSPWEETERVRAASVPPDRARVYVFRDTWGGAGEDFEASAAGQGEVALPARSFTVFEGPPGTLDVTVKAENTATLRLEASPGRAHYVRVIPKIGWSRTRAKLAQLGEPAGLEALAPLRLAKGGARDAPAREGEGPDAPQGAPAPRSP